MKKHLSAVKTPLGALVVGVAGLLLLLFTAYGLTRLASRGEVMGRVEVAGTQIGGLDEEQALSALLAVEEEYLGRPAVFNIEGKFVSMPPAPEAGLDIDEQAIADEALLVGRNGNVIFRVRLVAHPHLRHRVRTGQRIGGRRGDRRGVRHLGRRSDRTAPVIGRRCPDGRPARPGLSRGRNRRRSCCRPGPSSRRLCSRSKRSKLLFPLRPSCPS